MFIGFNTGAGTSPSPAIPNQTRDGDLLVAVAFAEASQAVAGTTDISIAGSGWTLQADPASGSGRDLAVWTRPFDPLTDTAGTTTFTFTESSSAQIVATLITVAGIRLVDPIASITETDVTVAPGVPDTSHPLAGVTTTARRQFVLAAIGTNGAADFTGPAGWEQIQNSGSGRRLATYHSRFDDAGATGDVVVTSDIDIGATGVVIAFNHAGPYVAATKTYDGASAGSHTIDLTDLNIESGDLIAITVGHDGGTSPEIDPAATPYDVDGFICVGWDRRGTTTEWRTYWFARKADGTETDFVVDFWDTGASPMQSIVYVIAGWSGQLERIQAFKQTTQNFGAVSWAWGTDDVILINSVYANPVTGDPTWTSVPNNLFDQTIVDGTTHALAAAMRRMDATSSYDPNAFNGSDLGAVSGLVLVVGGPYTPAEPDPTPIRTGTFTDWAVGGVPVVQPADYTPAAGESGPAAGDTALVWVQTRVSAFAFPTVTGWTLEDSDTNVGGSGSSAALYTRTLDGTSSDDFSIDFAFGSWSINAVSYRETGGVDSAVAEFRNVSSADATAPSITPSARQLAVVFAGGTTTRSAAFGVGPRGGGPIVLAQPNSNVSAEIAEVVVEVGDDTTFYGIVRLERSTIFAGIATLLNAAAGVEVALATATETVTAQPLALAADTATLEAATAAEATTANPLALAPDTATLEAATAVETVTAQPLAVVALGATLTTPTATEATTANPLTVAADTVTITTATATETVTAQPLTVTIGDTANLDLATATETVTAQPLALIPVTVTLETATGAESVTANPLDLAPVIVGIAVATGVDQVTAQPLALAATGDVTLTVAGATETVTAAAVAVTIPVAVQPIGVRIPAAGLSRIVLESPTNVTIDTGT